MMAIYENYSDGLKIWPEGPGSLALVTVCVVVFDTGFIAVGKSVPLKPEEFEQTKGRAIARADAMKQALEHMAKERRGEPTKGHREFE